RFSVFGQNQAREIASVSYPEQNSVGNTYDSRNNIVASYQGPKPGSALPSLSSSRTYPESCSGSTQATCNKPTTITDPNGNTTEFTYNSDGQVLTEKGPGPAPRPITT